MFLCRKKVVIQCRETQTGNTTQQQWMQLDFDNKKLFPMLMLRLIRYQWQLLMI